jgi:hypothetical protein
MPESPRYTAHVQSRLDQAASDGPGLLAGQEAGSTRVGLRAFLMNRRWLIMLAATAGCWFLLDYAYYGNTISTPQILSLISPHAATMTKITLQLAIFLGAAVPGYVLAIARLDRIGHRKLQLIGFAMMALCFLIIAAVLGMTTTVAPFLLDYGIGSNMTTFVLPSELYPVTLRTTGHGISGHRQARRIHRRLPLPAAPDVAGPARHPVAHRRCVRARPRPHHGAARAGRAQPRRHRCQQHPARGHSRPRDRRTSPGALTSSARPESRADSGMHDDQVGPFAFGAAISHRA